MDAGYRGLDLGAVSQQLETFIDEELSNLIVLQNSFAASARIITTINRMFEDLLNVVV